MLQLSSEISRHLGDGDGAFDKVFSLRGEIFRHVENRETLRVRIGDEHYFLKRHRGLGWKNIVRTLLACRWPVVSARNEVEAVECLTQAGIPSVEVVAWGERGLNPATCQSFVLMKELRGCTDLEKLCLEWKTSPPPPRLRQALIEAVARTTLQMHRAGVNHRDYYLCHLWLEPTGSEGFRLRVMDLHRAMRHSVNSNADDASKSPSPVPLWWRIKDLAGVLFSAWDCGLTKSDCLRFLKIYCGQSARNAIANERWLWRLVICRARRLFHKTHGRAPHPNLSVPSIRLRVPDGQREANHTAARTPPLSHVVQRAA